jgi:hypothetical protein
MHLLNTSKAWLALCEQSYIVTKFCLYVLHSSKQVWQCNYRQVDLARRGKVSTQAYTAECNVA